MKKLLLLFLAVAVAAGCFSGCAARQCDESWAESVEGSITPEEQEPQSVEMSEPQGNVSSSPPENLLDNANDDILVPAHEAQSESGAQEPVAIPEGATLATIGIQGEEFLIYLPSKWAVKGDSITEDERIVAVLDGSANLDDVEVYFNKLDEINPDAVNSGDLSALGVVGKYYCFQTVEETTGGYINELRYYILVDNNEVVFFEFYPAFGIGIGTQREEFDSYIATVNIKP